MTKLADFIEKDAQSSGFVPSYRYGAAGSADKDLKGLGAAFGAAAGGAHWLWEKGTSEEALSWLAKAFDYERSNPNAFAPRTPRMSDMSFGRHKSDEVLPLMDHVRAGANVGAQPVTWKRLGSDAKTTAYGIGHDYFLVSDDKMNEVQKENDKAILDQMSSLGVDIPDSPPRDENGILVATGRPEYQEYDEFINGARMGQGVGRFGIGSAVPVAATKAVSRGIKAFGDASRYANAARRAERIADGALFVYPTAAGVHNGVRDIKEHRGEQDAEMLDTAKAILERFGPDSDQYRSAYEIVREAGLDIRGIPLPAPSSNHAGQAEGNVRSGPAPALRRGPTWGDWYNGMTDTGKAITVGAGGAGLGALLGAIFGGKGGWWKWGLLGALLGALGGNGKLKELWNGLSAGKAGNG